MVLRIFQSAIGDCFWVSGKSELFEIECWRQILKFRAGYFSIFRMNLGNLRNKWKLRKGLSFKPVASDFMLLSILVS